MCLPCGLCSIGWRHETFQTPSENRMLRSGMNPHIPREQQNHFGTVGPSKKFGSDVPFRAASRMGCVQAEMHPAVNVGGATTKITKTPTAHPTLYVPLPGFALLFAFQVAASC